MWTAAGCAYHPLASHHITKIVVRLISNQPPCLSACMLIVVVVFSQRQSPTTGCTSQPKAGSKASQTVDGDGRFRKTQSVIFVVTARDFHSKTVSSDQSNPPYPVS